MRKLSSMVIAFLLSTSFVLASPGMKGYTIPKVRQAQIAKIKKQAHDSKQELLDKIDVAIARLEKKPGKAQVNTELLAQIDKSITSQAKKRNEKIRAILADKNDFIRAFNHAKALREDLTQYNFKRELLDMLDHENLQETKSSVKMELARAGTLINYLKDLKYAIEEDNLQHFMASSHKEKTGRKIANIVGPSGGFVVIAGIFAVLSVVSIITGVSLMVVGVAVVLGLALVVIPIGLLALLFGFPAAMRSFL